ncbi:hypothetical protein AEQU1_01378 [Aequorivita sp. CIP111184]|nr:hypothetical protein AEQU1_01378 [Aequorivita sp. CIP111184]
MKKKGNLILLSIGLLFNAAVLLLSHYTKLPDFVMGSLMGIGIGIMLLFVIRRRRAA